MTGTTDADGARAGAVEPSEDEVEIVLIAAVAENRVVGRDGEIPWYLPADLRHFRETTTGHPVVMGRRTYEGIVDRLDEPLPGRTSVVLSTRDLDLPAGAVRAGSIEEALALAREDARERGVGTVYVAGGAIVYEQFLPLADRLVLTEVHDAHEGDARFPDVAWSDWREVRREERDGFAFVEYERRRSAG